MGNSGWKKIAERKCSTPGAAGVDSVKTKYKYKINLIKNAFCCKSNFKPRTGIGLRQSNGNLAYTFGMIIYIFALLLVSLRCFWSGRVGGAEWTDLVVFAQWSSCNSNILSNGRANIPTAARPHSLMKSPSPCYRLIGYLLITILLAADVHLNLRPVGQVERKPLLLDTFELVNATELHQGIDNRYVSQTATLQNTILNLNGCIHKEHLNSMTTKRKFELFQPVNQAKVLWDRRLKPKGLLGGHLKIRSIVWKTV